MHDASPIRPKLLVSVRNAHEARDALAGGCDILDVKEPANGSLGMADVGVIREVVATAGVQASACSDVRTSEGGRRKAEGGSRKAETIIPHPSSYIPHPSSLIFDELQRPVSAALGETRDWRNRKSVPVLPPGLHYAKLGTAGLDGTATWERDWRTVRARFDAVAESPPQWVAVAYADWRRAAAPPPDAILHAAIAGGCAGFLIDTCVKNGRSLFGAMPPGAIAEVIAAAREAKLFVALAGSLSGSDLETAAALRPDVVAVRSAACLDGRRDAPICRDAVRRLRETLDCEFRRSNPLDEIRAGR
jgi:(5-formylfuran-3-yl)methyl phosphate synthase